MSSGKNTLPRHAVLTAGDMSLSSVSSAATDITFMDNVGYQLIWTGTPTGTFAAEVSNDDGTTWTALTLSAVPTAAGSAGNYGVSLNQVPFAKSRITYTKTSGTGSLTIYIVGKAI